MGVFQLILVAMETGDNVSKSGMLWTASSTGSCLKVLTLVCISICQTSTLILVTVSEEENVSR